MTIGPNHINNELSLYTEMRPIQPEVGQYDLANIGCVIFGFLYQESEKKKNKKNFTSLNIFCILFHCCDRKP